MLTAMPHEKTELLSLEILFIKNQYFCKNYEENSLLKLIKSQAMADKENRTKLLDCIQVFSDYFQKVVMLRNIFSEQPAFLEISHTHLLEEFGHNRSLMKDRHFRPRTWDAILDATSSWFAWKMFTLNDEEKTVLIHLVLEASANIFFHEAHKVMSYYGETDYFKIHANLDEEHAELGNQLLADLSPAIYQRLFEIQHQGWDMVNAACERIAQVVTSIQ